MEVFLLFIILVISSYLDYEKNIVYSPFNMAISLLALIHNIINDYNSRDILLGYLLIPLILFLINYVKNNSIGDGDIEFLSSMGIYLGYQKQVIAFFIGILVVFIYSLINKKERYPLIPFLSFGFVITLVIF